MGESKEKRKTIKRDKVAKQTELPTVKSTLAQCPV